MKQKLFFALATFGFALTANAQKPFKEIGKDNEVEILTLSNGRYVEYFTNDTLRRIGSVMFNTITNKVEYFIPQDDIIFRAELDRAKEASRWMSIDPLTNKFPSQSPYSAMDNNPILKNDPTGESGEVAIDKQSKTLTVTSKITLYGGGANKFLATTTAMDVQNTWNKAAGKVTLDGVSYNVKFVVTGEYKADGGVLKKEIESNTDIKNNYYRVESGTDEYWTGTSYTDDKGANTGYLDRAQIVANNSTTEGHEMGHGFGSDHDTNPNGTEGTDYRGKGQPNIMLTAFDAVDKKYQGPDGDLNPSTRVAKQENINKLGLDKLNFDKNGKADLGKKTNEYHKK